MAIPTCICMSNDHNTEKDTIKTVLSNNPLCDSCIGRLFGETNRPEVYDTIGKKIRENHTKIPQVEPDDCILCEGLSTKQDRFLSIIKKTLEGYEFTTFLLGLHVHNDILEKEKEIMDLTHGEDREALKNYLNRVLGLKLEKQLGKEVDFADPDIMVIIDSTFDVVRLQIKSLFIYGRYLKFRRDMPQTKWFCRDCRGKGCRFCEYSGTKYERSVEQLVAEPFLNETNGLDDAFHGAGREDIDVRMLGTGRPFVLEIKNPVKRTIDFESITQSINNKNDGIIAVQNLKYTQKETVARIKDAHFPKIYRVQFDADGPFEKEKLKKVALTLRGSTINQFTPTRVELRRARMIRKRKVYDCRVENVENTLATCVIEAESGTYIKELVTGDNGRTQPSISDLLGVPCTVRSLDVIEIKGE